MPLQFTKPERISLKGHPEFTEKWLQEQIINDPTLLGLGDVELVTAEKIQPKAGRLDLLLHDDQLNRRYEVELMLGATDPSHIMRCIEYWDIERRRYPAYDHVAVLVAEDITSRFLNLISLLSGSIPLIAIQFVALKIDDKIVLHFVHVLDQTTLRTDDTYELGEGPGGGPATMDRAYWENRISPEIMKACDDVLKIVQELSKEPYSHSYRKKLIYVVPPGSNDGRIWLFPQKTQMRIGGYVAEPEEWVKRFDDNGQVAWLKRGNKAVSVSYKPGDFQSEGGILRQFLKAVLEIDNQAGSEGE